MEISEEILAERKAILDNAGLDRGTKLIAMSFFKAGYWYGHMDAREEMIDNQIKKLDSTLKEAKDDLEKLSNAISAD